MKSRHTVLSVLGLALLTACLDVTSSGTADSEVRIVNATGQTVNIFLDDRLAIDASQQLNVSQIIVASGVHKLALRDQNGVETSTSLTLPPAGFTGVYAYTQPSGSIAVVVMDTLAVPAAGQSAARVINVSKLATNVDIYGSGGDGAAATQFISPFPYLTVSPYVTKPAGSWEVYYTAAGSATKVRSTGAFPLEEHGRRTVFLIDSGSVPVFRILPR